MTKYKYVNGTKVQMTAEEETAFDTSQTRIQAEDAAIKTKLETTANTKTSGKAKLKAGEALTDDEISALFGD